MAQAWGGVDWLAALGKRLTLDDYRREKGRPGPAPMFLRVQVWWLWTMRTSSPWQFNLAFRSIKSIYISWKSIKAPAARPLRCRTTWIFFPDGGAGPFFFLYFICRSLFFSEPGNDDCCSWWWNKHSKSSLGPPLAENSVPLRQRPFASESPINTARRDRFVCVGARVYIAASCFQSRARYNNRKVYSPKSRESADGQINNRPMRRWRQSKRILI